MPLDPDRSISRQIIDIVDLRNDRARHALEIGGNLSRILDSISNTILPPLVISAYVR